MQNVIVLEIIFMCLCYLCTIYVYKERYSNFYLKHISYATCARSHACACMCINCICIYSCDMHTLHLDNAHDTTNK